MKKQIAVLCAFVLVLMLASRSVRAYSYFFTETPPNPTDGNWTNNGMSVQYYSPGGYSGVGGGSGMMMYNYPSYGAEISMTVRTTNIYSTAYTMYLLAGSPNDPMGSSGNYYKILVNGYGNTYIYQVTNGSSTVIGQVSTVLHDGSVVRAVAGNGEIGLYTDNFLVFSTTANTLGQTYFGIGGGDTSGDGILITSVSIGNIYSSPPSTISYSSMGISTYLNHIDMQWPAANDGTGPGIYEYVIYRNGQIAASVLATQTLAWSDTTVVPDTTYNYTISPVDYHFNSSSTSFTAMTQTVTTNPPYPSSTPEGREVGVRTTGAYWGASGENIDVRSGNLNFAIPLLKAQGRGRLGCAI